MENGYTYLMNLSVGEICDLLKITEEEARKVKIMTMPELLRCEHICIEEKNILNLKAKCREKAFCCRDCRKEFLENEIKPEA